MVASIKHKCNLIFSESNYNYNNMLRQHSFLKQLVEKLGTEEGANTIKSALNDVRQYVTNPSNLRVHMAAHVQSLCKSGTSPSDVWVSNFIPENVKATGEK